MRLLMHDSVMSFGVEHLTPDICSGADVLEVGSLDVNGSLRPWIEAYGPTSYVGIDIRPGPGVDVVFDAANISARSWFDLIVSTEMLEHCLPWKQAMRKMTEALRKGGHLLLTARGPGAGKHDHPADYWRFTPDHMRECLGLLGYDVLDVRWDHEIPGVLCFARKARSVFSNVELPDAETLVNQPA